MEWGKEQISQPLDMSNTIRLFITIKKEDQNIEYKKLTIMAPVNLKISMLKRHIEREFSDLFPHEPTFICAKLEDEFGYSLSNTSFVHELLKNSDRLSAIPESFSKDLIGKMHLTHDINELTFMLKSITQTIVAKLAEADLGSPQTQQEILQLVVPIGFTLQQKAINHNTGIVLKKILESERLQFLEDPQHALISQLLVKLISFWTNDLIFQDQFLLNITVDLLEILLKSATFAQQFKNAQTINCMMSVSKLEFVSAQTRSRMIKIISYLSRPNFGNSYNPKQYDMPLDVQPRPRRILNAEETKQNIYIPSVVERRPPSNRRQEIPSREQNQPVRQPILNNNQYQNSPQYYTQPLQQEQQQYRPQQEFNQSANQFDQSGIRGQSQLPPRTRLQSGQKQYFNPQQQVFDGLVQDYLNLLSTESNEEMLQFAVQNLSDGIETTIHQIMDSKEAFQKVINLLEIAMNPNFQGMQLRVLEHIASNMNEARAKESVKMKLIPRIMKAFTYQPKDFHNTLYDMLSATLKLSDFEVDVLTVITMIESPYTRISNLGIKILALMSDPVRLSNNNIALQFENYVKQLMEWTLDTNKGEEFQFNSLAALSNLALNDQIRPQLLYMKGVQFFLKILRESFRVDAQRMAAKALLNLSIKSREVKLTIVSELGEEMKRMQKGDMDTIVQGYLQALVATRERSLI